MASKVIPTQNPSSGTNNGQAYGSWTSPLTSLSLAGTSKSIRNLSISSTQNLHWVETRPDDQGRSVVVKLSEQKDDNIITKDVIPSHINSHSGVHNYGGVSYKVMSGPTNSIVSCNADDGRLYFIHNKCSPLTPECSFGKWLYCDMNQNPKKPTQLFAIREQHMTNDQVSDVVNCLVCIDMTNVTNDAIPLKDNVKVIASGNTFYSFPRVDMNGMYLAYITWNFPSMPWDDTSLYLAKLNSVTGEITSQVLIDSGSSILQPTWSIGHGNDLYYISDKNGYWEIFRYCTMQQKSFPILTNTIQYEFGWPSWQMGLQRFDFLDDNTILAAVIQNAKSSLIKINNINDTDIESTIEFIDLDENKISYIAELLIDRINPRKIYLLASGYMSPQTIYELQISSKTTNTATTTTTTTTTTLKALIKSVDTADTVDPKYISIPKSISFKTTNNDTAYAWIYEPKNDDIKLNDNVSKPPLLVLVHGGPTSMSPGVYSKDILFFTSRGWMVANVNYRGSSGYGTKYRKLLNLNWGIYDRDDCCAIVEHLKREGLINSNQCAIRGGSSGGYTVLRCLTMDIKNTFNVGCSQYGISDLNLLLKDTHKFEVRYLYPLLGYDKKILYDRSPINSINNVKSPIIFEHGELDQVVPPNQAELMFEALKKNNITTCKEIMKGEGHGFTKAESKIKALDFEYRFYSEMLGFALSKQDDDQMKKPNIIYGK